MNNKPNFYQNLSKENDDADMFSGEEYDDLFC